MSEIKVSVIIPAYNVEKYIKRTLESVLKQTLKEIEIIVINDGSTDRTYKIIEEMAIEDERVKIINKKNGGISSARNTGLEIARGKYIQNLDGDDWIEKNALKTLYEISEENNLDILISDFYRDNDSGDIKIIRSNNRLGVMDNKEYLEELLLTRELPYIWNKFIKNEIHKEIRYPIEISLGEDMVVSAKLGYSARRIMYQPCPFVHYINNKNSITRKNSRSEKEIQKFMAVDLIEDYLLEKENSNQMEILIEKYRFLNINQFLYQNSNFKSKKYNEAYEYFIHHLKKMNPDILGNIISRKQLYILKIMKKNPNKIIFRILNFIIRKILSCLMFYQSFNLEN